MVKILTLDQIKKVLENIDVVKKIETGFVAYSQNKVVVPPVGEMLFDNPRGECHIKYGFIKGDDYYVIKIASGFYDNPKLGLPGNDGLNLLFDQKTGRNICILLDEGYLTNVRTAAAGAVCAKYLAPKQVTRIGVFGCGVQGKMQLSFLKPFVACRKAIVWGINPEELEKYRIDMIDSGYELETTQESEDVTATCNLIITCTPSKTPLILGDQIRKGTHITAMGSDTAEKQELDSKIFQMADRVVADSLAQSQTRGECYRARQNGDMSDDKIFELGRVILDKRLQRSSDQEITVADLTGVAVQDLQISKAVWEGCHLK